MTDQPASARDDTPHGGQPPSYTPLQGPGSAYPSAGPHPEPDFGQPLDQAGRDSHEYRAGPGQSYGQGPADFSQPAGPYSQEWQQYPAPGQPGVGYNAYGHPAYYAPPSPPKTLSIASLCCGVAVFAGFGFFLLPQIAAVILGHMALSREPAGRGMAIAGLVLGYVGIALTILAVVLLALLFSTAGVSTYGA